MAGQSTPRLYHLRTFAYPLPGAEWMTQVTMETHIGSHIEGPPHYMDAFENCLGVGKDLSQIPLDMFFGEAVLIVTSKLSDGAPITKEFLEQEGVRKDDIVIIGLSGRSPEDSNASINVPYMSDGAVDWLASLPIKMIAFDRTAMPGLEDNGRINDPKRTPQTVRGRFESMYLHKTFLSRWPPINIIECIGNLDRLTKKRFFFIAWPANLGGLEAFPVRCVAFEPKK